MTSKERTLASINHEQPDRVPIDLRFAPELLDRLKSEINLDDAEIWEWIGQDVYTVRPTFLNPASDLFYADPTINVTDKGYFLDIYNVPFKKNITRFQTYMELVNEPPLIEINTINGLNKFPWPKVDDWDYSRICEEMELKKDKALWSRSRGCFQTAQFMRGIDTFLVDLVLNPLYACNILDNIMDFVIQDVICTLEAGNGLYTFVEYNDDVAAQRSMLISPDMWRDIIKPRMITFCDIVHSYGVKVKYHSCGSIYSIIPDLIEIGVDILNPIQPLAENMDPFKLKREFGDFICFHGAVDIQDLLINANEQEVKSQIKKLIEIMGDKGGYILAGSHTIQADAKTGNIIALVETAKEMI
jgi:uroporphyrinogen decarboxylase